MPHVIERIGVLLLIAAVVAMLTRRLRVPYSVGLVATGIAMAMLSVDSDIRLTKDLIFSVLLPPLIFEAAFFLKWSELRKDFWVITTLATVGVVLSCAVTAVGMHYLASWEWTGAVIFGVLIAATDPVSVIAMFKDAGASGRLRILVEAESLFNDGTAAVLFVVAIAISTGTAVTAGFVGLSLLTTVGGGIGCGALVARILLFLSGRADDRLLEITFTAVAAYGSFLLAEHFHFSGVLATLTTGLIMGNLGPSPAFSPGNRVAIEAFWEFVAFAANSLIFVLIGIHEEQQNFAAVWKVVMVAIALVMIGRAAAVYPTCWLFARTNQKVDPGHQHVLVWGGLRGALALALALSLPDSLARRDEIVTVAFAVVAFSIFVQGLSMASILRRLGEVATPAEEVGRSDVGHGRIL
jgi:CPA1 family monovalent cation:H+ antiporter